MLDVLRWKLGMAKKEQSALLPAEDVTMFSAAATPTVDFSILPASDCARLTWIGHSTFLLQHRGCNILTDPIFGGCSPLPIGGLARFSPPGVALEALPPIHHVLISHSHYDHLDEHTIRALGRGTRYWVPERLSEWFRRRGFSNCHELRWWESATLAEGMAIHCVPAQHFSARGLFDRNRTHWCGWVVKSAERSMYFAGDTGYCPLFQEIGRRFGGFDLSMLPIGAYNPRWLMRPMHLDPAAAVQVHLDTASHLSVAGHWGTFRLTDEPLTEPPRLLRQELRTRQIDQQSFRVLRFGESIDV
jgi:N-acyl-phosphatidylethanolamine-hydrolysing phospholipase D